MIVKRAAGCTENQGSWPQANWQDVVYFFSEMEILNVHNWSKTLFFQFATGHTRGLLYCTFHGDAMIQQLGRSYKLSASKNINQH